MPTCGRLQQWSFLILLAVSLTLTAAGCSKVPRYYVRMAERDVTLTDLVVHPEKYQGKVVLLGGALIEEEENEQYIWLRLKNRPLDQDYMPNRPVDPSGPEGGSYWVTVEKNQLPQTYRTWARMTVAGRVTGTTRFETEPVLALLYVRGLGIGGKPGGVWEHINPNYVPGPPGGGKYPNMPGPLVPH